MKMMKPIKRNTHLTRDDLLSRQAMNKTINKLANGDFAVRKDIVEEIENYLARQDDDPNIQLLNECIEGANKRISLYKMLQKGMWYATFKCDSTDEILRERMLIKEFINMKEDVIQWNKKQSTQ